MNLLFCSQCAVSPQMGGAERIITSLINVLTSREDVVCYSLYKFEIPDKFERTVFSGYLRYKPAEDDPEILGQFIKRNHIDICLCLESVIFLSSIVADLHRCSDVKIVCNHIFEPHREEQFFEKEDIRITSLKQFYSAVKTIYHKYLFHRWLHGAYNHVYQSSDSLVVMSPKHKTEFMKFGHIADGRKIQVIHNLLSYNDFFDMNLYAKKKRKEVLIVSRLSEVEKHIFYSLRIWQKIEQDQDLSDWHLTIVGHGDSEQDYKDFVKRHGLQRISFEGKQEPRSYYERASILMMTSPAESWGNVLTEAQQYACVPMAFDNLIALPIIITDGVNGVAIPSNNLRIYKKKLVRLMKEDVLRKELAGNAMTSSHRFEQQTIGNEWYELLKSLSK